MTDFSNLRRVETETGSYIVPPGDENWDDFTALQWHAAVVAIDTGLNISVKEGGAEEKRFGKWYPIKGSYSLQVGNSSTTATSYHEAWLYLNGVSTGAQEVRRG